MKTFKEFIAEADNEKTVEDLISAIESSFGKYFKDSHLSVSFSKSIEPSAIVRFTLGKGTEEYPSGMARNDPMYNTISVFGFDDDGNVDGRMKVSDSAKLRMVDSTGRSHSKTMKIGRRFSGSYDQVVKGFDKMFANLRDAVKSNLDDVQKVSGKMDVKKKV